jgi:hypothetical protein
VKKLQDNGVECSEMGWQRNVHDEEWRGRPSVVSDDHVQSVDKKFVIDGASQLQNFHVNFHEFHTLFSTRLSQLG